jgi:general secretion pathway protein G
MSILRVTRGSRGFTLVEIMIVSSIIGLLASIAVPYYAESRRNARTSTCVENMKTLDGAAQIWAAYSGAADDTTVSQATLEAERYIRSITFCPVNFTPYVDFALDVGPVCPNAIPNHVLP